MPPSTVTHVLAATCRCLTQDLNSPPAECDEPIEDLVTRHVVIMAFVEQRSQTPVGQERIRSVASPPCWSLHAGRFRAATWHDRASDMVWLLAAGIHREGSTDDAYRHFADLAASGCILPTADDVDRVLRRLVPSFDVVLRDEVPQLRQRALDQPATVHVAVLGGRIDVRVWYEASGDIGMLCIAIRTRMRPGVMAVPPGHIEAIWPAFFPSLNIDELDLSVRDLGGDPVRADEIAACELWRPHVRPIL